MSDMTDAELHEWATDKGYVKAPDCEECDGTGTEWDGSFYVPGTVCPSCGGLGKKPKVAVDGIDYGRGAIERATYMLERMVADRGPDTQDRMFPALAVLKAYLAALDQEDTR